MSAVFVESTLGRIEPRLDRATPVLGQRSCQGLSRCRQVSPRCRRGVAEVSPKCRQSVAARRRASPNGPSVAKVSPSVAKRRQVSPWCHQVSPNVSPSVAMRTRQVSPKCIGHQTHYILYYTYYILQKEPQARLNGPLFLFLFQEIINNSAWPQQGGNRK